MMALGLQIFMLLNLNPVMSIIANVPAAIASTVSSPLSSIPINTASEILMHNGVCAFRSSHAELYAD